MLFGVSCIRYSFSGSTLPSHIKTVSIPLPDNATSKVGLEQKLYDGTYATFVSMNQLQVIRSGGDAELQMKITDYRNQPEEFDAQGNVKTYKVVITADIRFVDRKGNTPIYQGTLFGIGVYSHDSETENVGIDNALKKLTESVVNNTISGW
jgi:hypothetical protein